MLSRLEKRLIDQARMLAPLCSGGRCMHISFLVRRTTIKSIGINQFKTDTFSARFKKYRRSTRHAEAVAIKNFNYLRNPVPIHHCSLYSIRIRPGGVPSFAFPCSGCLELIEAFEIKRVFYTGDDGNFHSWNEPIHESWYSIMKEGKRRACKLLILPVPQPV